MVHSTTHPLLSLSLLVYVYNPFPLPSSLISTLSPQYLFYH